MTPKRPPETRIATIWTRDSIRSDRLLRGDGGLLARLDVGTGAEDADHDGEEDLDHVEDGPVPRDRRASVEPGAHLHGHLGAAETMVMEHHDGLDLGVIVRIVAREQLDAAPRGHPEARGGIRDALAGDRGQQRGEDPDPRSPRRRGAVAVDRALEEA